MTGCRHLCRSPRVCACSCDEVDALRVSVTSSDGVRYEIGVYCADDRPPMLMSGAAGSLRVTLTSRSPSAATASTRNGFNANFNFVTGTHSTLTSLIVPYFFVLLGGIAESDSAYCDTHVTVVWSVTLSVCTSVCMSSVTLVHPAKAVGRNEMPSDRDTPCRALRSASANVLSVTRSNLSFGSRAFRIAAATVWNSLPPHIRSCTTLTTFHKHLKSNHICFNPPFPLPNDPFQRL